MKILLIDHDRVQAEKSLARLSAMGHKCLVAESFHHAKELLSTPDHRIQLLLADHMMEGNDGFNFVLGLPTAFPALGKVCVLTSGITRSEANQLQMAGIEYFVRPITFEKLLSSIKVPPPLIPAKKPELPKVERKGSGLLGLSE